MILRLERKRRERVLSLCLPKNERERERKRETKTKRESLSIKRFSLSLLFESSSTPKGLCREESFVLLKRSEEEEMRFFFVCVQKSLFFQVSTLYIVCKYLVGR